MPKGGTLAGTGKRWNNETKANESNGQLFEGGNSNVYAIRIYNYVLSEKEVKQNHVADLAKWFALDVDGYFDLTDAQKEALHAEVEAFTFESNEVEIQSIVNTAIKGHKITYTEGGDAIYARTGDEFIHGIH